MQISWYNVNSWKVRKLTWYYICLLCWEQWCFIQNKYVQLNDSSIWHLQMFTCKVKHFYTHFCTWLLTLLMFNYVYTQVYTHVYTNDYTHFYTQEKENFTQRHPPSQPSAHICAYCYWSNSSHIQILPSLIAKLSDFYSSLRTGQKSVNFPLKGYHAWGGNSNLNF